MPTVAFRFTRKRRLFANYPIVIKAFKTEFTGVIKPHFIKLLKAYVSGWKTAVAFQARKQFATDFIKLNVFASGPGKKIFNWVSRGTEGPYPIVAKNVPTLLYRKGYQAKTQAGNLSYKGPGKATGEWRSPVAVMHPGIEPRLVEETLMEQEKGWFIRQMENTWRRALRKANKAG